MVSFLVFGLVFVPAVIGYWDLKAWIYALLSLTVLRMLPVALGFGFFKLDLPTRLFIGWFGPRGIASILYILVAVGQLGNIQGHESIYATAALTILLSILLHGLSAQPLARLYSRWVARHPLQYAKESQ
jgi:NhaP-type Na+/H+ or K+/H+ antiporter